MYDLEEKIKSLGFVSDETKSEILTEANTLSLDNQRILLLLLDTMANEEEIFVKDLSHALIKKSKNAKIKSFDKIDKLYSGAMKNIDDLKIAELKKSILNTI
jgi:hypothetical protein